ncbi:MAG: AAA family ATPase, partial [Paracoccaceae bacterium]
GASGRRTMTHEEMRGVIDENRRKGRKAGQFLILGSAAIDLLRQSGESLAGRIEYCEMFPLSVREVGSDRQEQLWWRGRLSRQLSGEK